MGHHAGRDQTVPARVEKVTFEGSGPSQKFPPDFEYGVLNVIRESIGGAYRQVVMFSLFRLRGFAAWGMQRLSLAQGQCGQVHAMARA